MTVIEKVTEFIRLNNSLYWRLRNSAKCIIAYHDDDSTKSIEKSIEKITRLISLLGEDTYVLETWNNKDQKKMHNNFSFQIKGYKSAEENEEIFIPDNDSEMIIDLLAGISDKLTSIEKLLSK